jgi:hypothetical protein
MGPHSDASLAYKEGTIEAVSTTALGNTITASIILNDSFTGGGIKFSAWDIEVNNNYVELLGNWGIVIMSFYFSGRTLEKVIDMKSKTK